MSGVLLFDPTVATTIKRLWRLPSTPTKNSATIREHNVPYPGNTKTNGGSHDKTLLIGPGFSTLLGCARQDGSLQMQARRVATQSEATSNDALMKKAELESPAIDRKIIRKAELTIEVPQPKMHNNK